MINYVVAFGAAAAYSAMDALSTQLASVGGRAPARRLRASYVLNSSFSKYRAGEYRQVPTMVLQSALNHPAYFVNRGVLSILLRSIAHIVRQPFKGRSMA